MRADFTLSGHHLMCIDSPVQHGFKFTPSISLFVDCVDEAEQASAFQQLSEGGGVLMPLANYGFSRMFGWVNDRFGVSWQLNLPCTEPRARRRGEPDLLPARGASEHF